MNLTKLHRAAKRGFTLIEMVGVLGIIALLAAMLIPKVFNALNNSRINNACQGYNTIKAATAEYYSRFGRFGTNVAGDPLPAAFTGMADWDNVLLASGLIDKRFAVRIGNGFIGSATNGSHLRITNAVANNVAPTGAGQAYDLDGDDATGNPPSAVNDATGTWVVEAIIPGVSIEDAREVNLRLDGEDPRLAQASPTAADLEGRVVFAAPPATGPQLVDLHIYVAHR